MLLSVPLVDQLDNPHVVVQINGNDGCYFLSVVLLPVRTMSFSPSDSPSGTQSDEACTSDSGCRSTDSERARRIGCGLTRVRRLRRIGASRKVRSVQFRTQPGQNGAHHCKQDGSHVMDPAAAEQGVLKNGVLSKPPLDDFERGLTAVQLWVRFHNQSVYVRNHLRTRYMPCEDLP